MKIIANTYKAAVIIDVITVNISPTTLPRNPKGRAESIPTIILGIPKAIWMMKKTTAARTKPPYLIFREKNVTRYR